MHSYKKRNWESFWHFNLHLARSNLIAIYSSSEQYIGKKESQLPVGEEEQKKNLPGLHLSSLLHKSSLPSTSGVPSSDLMN